jgi:hypothetical protein
MAMKPPDDTAVPLCAAHHREGAHAYHRLGRKAFERKHGVSLDREIERLRAEYGRFW